MEAINKWNDIVIRGIMSFKDFGIKAVNNPESIKSMIFDKKEYPIITGLINDQNWEELKQFDIPGKIGFKEYLEIIRFYDQNNHLHIATIYDNDEPMQDPEVIDIITLT